MTHILSLDPSLSCIGFCVLDVGADTVVSHGIHKPEGPDLDAKLSNAYHWLRALFGELPPVEVFAIELAVMARNAKTTITLSQLTGVLRLAAWTHADRIIPILPQNRLLALGLPARMKRADAKAQVMSLVNARFDLGLKPAQHDVADAIAVALAAAKKLKLEEEKKCP